MEFKIYLYSERGELLGIYLAPTQEQFESNKLKYCSEFKEGENYISYTEIINPIIENGEIREMTISEKIKNKIIILKDGEFLENNEIKKIEKPDNYSIWNKSKNKWEEDKILKLQYLKDLRYTKQQEYVKYKKELEEKNDEKQEFEELGFDITETEERIVEISSEMDLLKKEIAKLSKEIKIIEKEVKE